MHKDLAGWQAGERNEFKRQKEREREEQQCKLAPIKNLKIHQKHLMTFCQAQV